MIDNRADEGKGRIYAGIALFGSKTRKMLDADLYRLV